MSLRQQLLSISKRLAATESDFSFPALYRELRGKTVAATQGTITDNFRNVYTRSYMQEVEVRESAYSGGVLERGDKIFHFSEDKLTPRSEEDEVYQGIAWLGQVSVNRNATRVTGSSISWTGVEPDDRIRFGGQGTVHRVGSVINTGGTLTLSEAYANATKTSATYVIYRPYQVIGWERDPSGAVWEIQGRRI